MKKFVFSFTFLFLSVIFVTGPAKAEEAEEGEFLKKSSTVTVKKERQESLVQKVFTACPPGVLPADGQAGCVETRKVKGDKPSSIMQKTTTLLEKQEQIPVVKQWQFWTCLGTAVALVAGATVATVYLLGKSGRDHTTTNKYIPTLVPPPGVKISF